MFYCDRCARRRNWPISDHRSRGPCEICHKEDRLCSDVPSSALPIPQRKGGTSK